MATGIVPFDSPGSVLQLYFWAGDDRTKCSVTGRPKTTAGGGRPTPTSSHFREFADKRLIQSSCTEKMNDRASRELSIDVSLKDVGVKTSRLRPIEVDDAHYANDRDPGCAVECV